MICAACGDMCDCELPIEDLGEDLVSVDLYDLEVVDADSLETAATNEWPDEIG